MDRKLITAVEAAALPPGCAKSTIFRARRDGEFPIIRMQDGQQQFYQEDIQKWKARAKRISRKAPSLPKVGAKHHGWKILAVSDQVITESGRLRSGRVKKRCCTCDIEREESLSEFAGGHGCRCQSQGIRIGDTFGTDKCQVLNRLPPPAGRKKHRFLVRCVNGHEKIVGYSSLKILKRCRVCVFPLTIDGVHVVKSTVLKQFGISTRELNRCLAAVDFPSAQTAFSETEFSEIVRNSRSVQYSTRSVVLCGRTLSIPELCCLFGISETVLHYNLRGGKTLSEDALVALIRRKMPRTCTKYIEKCTIERERRNVRRAKRNHKP